MITGIRGKTKLVLFAVATGQIDTGRHGHCRVITVDVLNDDYLVVLLPANDRRNVQL